MAQKNSIGPARIENYDDVLRFLFAGRAVFTLLDKRNDLRATYRVKENPNPQRSQLDADTFFVHVKLGDNYLYIGMLCKAQDGKFWFTLTKGSRLPVEDDRVRYFKAYILRMYQRQMPDFIHFWHEGICAKCGSALTVPESIHNGFGPVCLKRMDDKTKPMGKVNILNPIQPQLV